MPHLLELFSGTGSAGRAFAARGWRVTSVDLDPKAGATITSDIHNVAADDIVARFGPVDLIWASPPCTHYSCARTKASTPRDLEGSDRTVQKVLDLSRQLGADFLMENPYTGLLRTRPVVAGIPMRTVDYCMYGAPYRKRTALWTNTEFAPTRALCSYNCGSCEGRRHKERAQRGSWAGAGAGRRSQGLRTLYALPEALCAEIAAFAGSGA